METKVAAFFLAIGLFILVSCEPAPQTSQSIMLNKCPTSVEFATFRSLNEFKKWRESFGGTLCSYQEIIAKTRDGFQPVKILITYTP